MLSREGNKMPSDLPGGNRYGIPDDLPARKKVRDGLSDPEKAEFDVIIDKLDKGKTPDRNQRKKIRQWQQQGKIKLGSKRFKSPSDRKTHQEP
jgi:hypothetical protein